MTHTVPLKKQFGDACVDPQQVTKGHHTAAGHVVTTHAQGFYTVVSHNTLKQLSSLVKYLHQRRKMHSAIVDVWLVAKVNVTDYGVCDCCEKFIYLLPKS